MDESRLNIHRELCIRCCQQLTIPILNRASISKSCLICNYNITYMLLDKFLLHPPLQFDYNITNYSQLGIYIFKSQYNLVAHWYQSSNEMVIYRNGSNSVSIQTIRTIRMTEDFFKTANIDEIIKREYKLLCIN